MFRQDRTNPSTAVSTWKARKDLPRANPSTAVSNWLNGGLGDSFTAITATGGTIADYTADDGYSYRKHTFTSSGTFEITANPSGSTFEVLTIGAGGGAVNSGNGQGGGGGGGVTKHTSQTGNVESYTVTVGAGAFGTGNTTTFVSAPATTAALINGGGQNGSPNGSGGSSGNDGASGYDGTGSNSGGGLGASGGGGGGGGAGGTGTAGSGQSGGGGGAGDSVTGQFEANSTYSSLGGGGGGGGRNGYPFPPGGGNFGWGAAGGGNGGYGGWRSPVSNAQNGVANTGGGSGGLGDNGGMSGGHPQSKSGGSGLVIVRYLLEAV